MQENQFKKKREAIRTAVMETTKDMGYDVKPL